MAKIRRVEYPFGSFIPGPRSPDEWLTFNEVPWTCAPTSWTQSTAPWTYSTDFLIKINSLILENTRRLEFCRNTPELFENYGLVPKNLHLGHDLTFYIYN
jgi:hypothetical protein